MTDDVRSVSLDVARLRALIERWRALLAGIGKLPVYQLHISLERLEPLVMPFTDDPNGMGAFIRVSDLEKRLAAALPAVDPQPEKDR